MIPLRGLAKYASTDEWSATDIIFSVCSFQPIQGDKGRGSRGKTKMIHKREGGGKGRDAKDQTRK